MHLNEVITKKPLKKSKKLFLQLNKYIVITYISYYVLLAVLGLYHSIKYLNNIEQPFLMISYFVILIILAIIFYIRKFSYQFASLLLIYISILF